MEELDNNKKLELLRTRDLTISSYLSNGWYIYEDNPNSRQVILKQEWGFGSYIIAFLLLLLYIIPGLVYIGVKISKKKVINY